MWAAIRAGVHGRPLAAVGSYTDDGHTTSPDLSGRRPSEAGERLTEVGRSEDASGPCREVDRRGIHWIKSHRIHNRCNRANLPERDPPIARPEDSAKRVDDEEQPWMGGMERESKRQKG